MDFLYDVFVDTATKNTSDSFAYKSKQNIEPGTLVKLTFSRRKTFGIIHKRLTRSPVPVSKLSEIDSVVNVRPAISKNALALAEWISKYYVCPIGTAIFSLLPQHTVCKNMSSSLHWASGKGQVEFIAAPFNERLSRYSEIISSNSNGQTIMLFANYRLVDYAIRYFTEVLGGENVCELSDRLKTSEYKKRLQWVQNNKVKLIVGTRKTIFAPAAKINRVIIDQPTNFGYYNDRRPAYQIMPVALELAKHFSVNVTLGDNRPDLTAILLARRGQIKLSPSRHKQKATLLWQETNAQRAISTLESKLRLVVSPFLETGSEEKVSGISAQALVQYIDTPYSTISSRDNCFKLPQTRPHTVLATKKILDYPELYFDEIIIIGADAWLSLPSHDASYDFISMVWQLWQQARSKIIIQSRRPVPIIEELLSQPTSKALMHFMQTRQKFNLPPYTHEVIFKGRDLSAITNALPSSVNAQSVGEEVLAYYPLGAWPPSNIDDLYRLSQKINIDTPK